MSEWETFCDDSYYHPWRVRQRNEQSFNDGFHVQNRKEAAALVELLNRLELDLCEARTNIEDAKRALGANEHEGLLLAAQRVKEQHDRAQEAAVFANEKAEAIRLERDKVQEKNKKLTAFVESLVDALGPHTDINGSSVIPAAYAILRSLKEGAK